jgi:hypothetical protein
VTCPPPKLPTDSAEEPKIFCRNNISTIKKPKVLLYIISLFTKIYKKIIAVKIGLGSVGSARFPPLVDADEQRLCLDTHEENDSIALGV